jgi:hypothetical protein
MSIFMRGIQGYLTGWAIWGILVHLCCLGMALEGIIYLHFYSIYVHVLAIMSGYTFAYFNPQFNAANVFLFDIKTPIAVYGGIWFIDALIWQGMFASLKDGGMEILIFMAPVVMTAAGLSSIVFFWLGIVGVARLVRQAVRMERERIQ